MKFRLIVILITVAMLLWISGCSTSNDTAISPNIQDANSDIGKLPVFVSDYNPDKTPSAGMGILGLFQAHIDPKHMTSELVSLRDSALADVLEVVDITNFLRLAPCTNCVKIKSVSLDPDGNLVLSIGIKHPFPVGDPLKPITGRNRADLHVFNVEGIVISNSHGILFPDLGKTVSGLGLKNADGYSGYLDASIDEFYPTDATIHPYILHFDDYSVGNFDPSNPMGFQSVTDPPPSGNLVMAMGCDYDYQDYVFDLPLEPVDVIFAVGCTYAVSSASKNQRFEPEYRIPQHNKKAASEVEIRIISNDLKGEDVLSSARIEISVVDKSHGVAVGTALNEMRADSSVSNITVEIPNVTITPIVVDGSAPISGTGLDPSDPLIYEATITNSASAIEGDYVGLVKVADSYAPGLNESPLLGGMDGIKRVAPTENPLIGLFAIHEFATYQTFEINVAEGNEDPVAILLSNPSPAQISLMQTVAFDGTTSYDPDGSITLYEFDFIWDGVPANFVADVSNTTGVATSNPYTTQGTYTAGLKVTDDMGAFAFDSVTVEVQQVQVIYVDDSNTSGTENGTMQYPYNTIQEGLTAATAGFEVWVDDSGNNYTGPITLKSGVPLKSVNWDSDDGSDRATINHTGTNPVVTGANNATIDGFRITGGGTVSSLGRIGIRILNVNTTVKNCVVQNISYNGTIYGIVVENSTGSLIDSCEISSLGSTGSYNYVWGIYLVSSPITVRKCLIHDISVYDNYHFVGGINISSCNPQSGNHLVIKQNRIYAISSSGLLGGSYCNGFGILMANSTDVDIINNLIYSVQTGNYNYSSTPSGTHGICITDSVTTDMINNTIYDIHKNYYYGNVYGVRLINCTGFNGRNNIVNRIYHSGSFQSSYGVSAPAGTTWEYTDVFNTQSGLYTGGIAPGVGCISANPLFVNTTPGSEDFHLASGSPCINTGDPSISDPDSSRSDMGCYGGPGGNW